MENIIEVGSPQDKKSPFFLDHKLYCEVWEAFILKHDGKLKGKVSAWALILKGAFRGKGFSKWTVELKKSTMSGNSIFFPSIWNVLQYTLLNGEKIDLGEKRFEIRRKCLFGPLNIIKRKQKLGAHHVILAKTNLASEQIALLSFLFLEISPIESLEYCKYDPLTQSVAIRFGTFFKSLDSLSKIMQR